MEDIIKLYINANDIDKLMIVLSIIAVVMTAFVYSLMRSVAVISKQSSSTIDVIKQLASSDEKSRAVFTTIITRFADRIEQRDREMVDFKTSFELTAKDIKDSVVLEGQQNKRMIIDEIEKISNALENAREMINKLSDEIKNSQVANKKEFETITAKIASVTDDIQKVAKQFSEYHASFKSVIDATIAGVTSKESSVETSAQSQQSQQSQQNQQSKEDKDKDKGVSQNA